MTRGYSEKSEWSFAGVEDTTSVAITSSDALSLSYKRLVGGTVGHETRFMFQ